jgi:hypothetical protein
VSTDGGGVPPMKMAQARARLDRLALARQELHPGSQQFPGYCQRAAELWAAEARVWANLPKAPDFPLGTDSGAVLARAAEHAARFAESKSLSWWKTSGIGKSPLEAS